MTNLVPGTTQSADGTQLGYQVGGTGPAVVITHGSLANKEQWAPASKFLSNYCTVYVYDRRGRGDSGDGPDYALQREVEDIAAMLQVAGPGANLLGHAYGALCTLAYAEQHGLGGGTLLAYEPPLAVQGPIVGDQLPGFARLVAAGDLDGALEYALSNFAKLPKHAISKIKKTQLWHDSIPLVPTWTRELNEIDALGSDLGHYAVIEDPTELLAGTHTLAFLYQSTHDLAKIIKSSQVTDLKHADHFAHISDPQGLANVVVNAIQH